MRYGVIKIGCKLGGMPIFLSSATFISSIGVDAKVTTGLQQGEEVNNCEEDLFSSLEVMPSDCTAFAPLLIHIGDTMLSYILEVTSHTNTNLQ